MRLNWKMKRVHYAGEKGRKEKESLLFLSGRRKGR